MAVKVEETADAKEVVEAGEGANAEGSEADRFDGGEVKTRKG